MKKEDLSDIQKHSAGATVRHQSPFENLQSFSNEIEITQSFRKEWVIPFYFELNNQSDEWIQKMIELKPKITEQIILQNLGDFDWRTRSTGSYFASIKKSKNLEDIIGTHLLKSEVCYAGHQYAITIASFNTVKSPNYFNQYLEYYLNKPELYFDQGSVLIALKYLDEINGTKHVDHHLKNWESLLKWRHKNAIKNLENLKAIIPDKIDDLNEQIEELKPQDKEVDTERFHKSMETFNRIING